MIPNYTMEKGKTIYNLKTDKKNRVLIEELNPNEIKEMWDHLKELNKVFLV